MKITGLIWLTEVVDKLAGKHHVSQDEVKEIFKNNPRIHFVERGKFKGEDVYSAMGRADSGRYLRVFFIHKITHQALVLSARDMNSKERKRYGEK